MGPWGGSSGWQGGWGSDRGPGRPAAVRLDPRGSAPRRERTDAEEAELAALAEGDRVSHDSFGLGTVVRVEGTGRHAMAHVDFGGDLGTKGLLLRYAPVEKL